MVERRRRRARGLAGLAVLALAAVLIGVLSRSGGSRHTSTRAQAGVSAGPALRASPCAGLRLGCRHRFRTLPRSRFRIAPSPCSADSTRSDASTTDVIVLAGDRLSTVAQLPLAQHDAQGALLGEAAYIFGGGQVSSYDHVLRFDLSAHRVSAVGALPRAASDVAVAALGASAYVIGGYDGEGARHRFSHGGPKGPRGSSRACPSRCATPPQRRSADRSSSSADRTANTPRMRSSASNRPAGRSS